MKLKIVNESKCIKNEMQLFMCTYKRCSVEMSRETWFELKMWFSEINYFYFCGSEWQKIESQLKFQYIIYIILSHVRLISVYNYFPINIQ